MTLQMIAVTTENGLIQDVNAFPALMRGNLEFPEKCRTTSWLMQSPTHLLAEQMSAKEEYLPWTWTHQCMAHLADFHATGDQKSLHKALFYLVASVPNAMDLIYERIIELGFDPGEYDEH